MEFDIGRYDQPIASLKISSAANGRTYFGMTRVAIVMNPSISEIDIMDRYEAVPP